MDTRYCNKPLCKVVTERHAAYFNYGCNLTDNVHHIMVHISLFYRFNNVYRQFPIDLTEDFCDYVKYRNPLRTPLLYQNNIFKMLNGTSNILRCSFEAGQYYYVRNLLIFKMIVSNQTGVLPNGDYRVRIEFITHTKEIGTTVIVYFQVYSVAFPKPPIKNRTKLIFD